MRNKGFPKRIYAASMVGAAVILLLTLSSCASKGSTTGDTHAVRSVIVHNPVWDSGFDECINDDAVKTAIQSADLPSSRLSLTLKDDVNDDDVNRVVDCLKGKLQEGTIELLGED